MKIQLLNQENKKEGKSSFKSNFIHFVKISNKDK